MAKTQAYSVGGGAGKRPPKAKSPLRPGNKYAKGKKAAPKAK